MKKINEIIDELKNHPDFCYAEIFTWNDIIETLNEELIDNDMKPIII